MSTSCFSNQIKHATLFLLVYLSVIPTVFAQVSFERSNQIFYPLLNNNFTIVVDNIPCDKLYIMAEFGRLIRRNDPCDYTYNYSLIGSDYLHIFELNGSDTILLEKKEIIISSWPNQKARFGNRDSGKVSRGFFLAQAAIFVSFSDLDIRGQHQVVSYDITLVRSNEKVFTLKNVGGRIESENRKKLKIIESKDIIHFTKIYAVLPGEPIAQEMNTVKITIK